MLLSKSSYIKHCVSSRNPKRDLGGLKYWRFAWNTLSETKIYTPKRDDEHSRVFHMGVPPPPPGDCSISVVTFLQ